MPDNYSIRQLHERQGWSGAADCPRAALYPQNREEIFESDGKRPGGAHLCADPARAGTPAR